MAITGDPLPYGITPNRRVLEELLFHAVSQGIITEPMKPDELFAQGTFSLVA
jgi:4,5-dihydroxyphthalate decarboxylase